MFESDLINIGLYILAAGFLLYVSSLFIQQYKEKILSIGAGVIIAGMIISFYIPVSTLVSFRTCEYFVGHIDNLVITLANLKSLCIADQLFKTVYP